MSNDTINVYPIIIVFDPNETQKISSCIEDCKNDLSKTPIKYVIADKDGITVLSRGKSAFTVADLVAKIQKRFDYKIFSLNCAPNGETKKYFFTSIDEYIEQCRNSWDDFWYQTYIFICPFALVFCHNNIRYSKFLPFGHILHIPLYECSNLNHNIKNKLKQLYNFNKHEYIGLKGYYPETHHFYKDIKEAAYIWADSVIKKFENSGFYDKIQFHAFQTKKDSAQSYGD